jgi:PAS domain-containing protein
VGVIRPAGLLPSFRVGPAALVPVAWAFFGPGDSPVDAEIRALFDAAPTGQFLIDANLRILVANSAAHRMFTSTGEMLRGRSFDALFVPASKPSLGALFSDLRSGSSPTDRLTTEGLAPGAVPFPAEVVIVRLPPKLRCPFGAVVRSLAEAAMSPTSATKPGTRAYSLPELLLANRLKEMV